MTVIERREPRPEWKCCGGPDGYGEHLQSCGAVGWRSWAPLLLLAAAVVLVVVVGALTFP